MIQLCLPLPRLLLKAQKLAAKRTFTVRWQKKHQAAAALPWAESCDSFKSPFACIGWSGCWSCPLNFLVLQSCDFAFQYPPG